MLEATNYVYGLSFFFFLGVMAFFMLRGWYLYFFKRKVPKSHFYLLFYYSLYGAVGVLLVNLIYNFYSLSGSEKFVVSELYVFGIGSMGILMILTYYLYLWEKRYEERRKK